MTSICYETGTCRLRRRPCRSRMIVHSAPATHKFFVFVCRVSAHACAAGVLALCVGGCSSSPEAGTEQNQTIPKKPTSETSLPDDDLLVESPWGRQPSARRKQNLPTLGPDGAKNGAQQRASAASQPELASDPNTAQARAAYLYHAAQVAAREGDHTRAFQSCQEAWLALRAHPNHPGCQQMEKEIMGALRTYGEAANRSALGSGRMPSVRKRLVVE